MSRCVLYCSQQVRERPPIESKMNTYTTREHTWKEFFNEVAEHCNYWELGFGAIDAEYESEVVRQAYVNGLDVDEACDQWHDAIQEIALGG